MTWPGLFTVLGLLAAQTWAGPSIQELERSVEVQPKNAALRFNLGLAYFQSGAYAKAEGAFAEAEKLDPKDGEARILHGISLQALQRGSEAQKALEAGLKLKPDSYDGHKYLAQSYLSSGAPDKAAREFERCAALRPQLAEPWLQLGMIQSDAGKPKDAEKSLRKALAMEPANEAAQAELASVLVKQERYPEAQAAASKALAAKPDDSYAMHSLGTSQYKSGQLDKALQTYGRLEKMNPKDPLVQARLGMIYYETKNYEKARASLSRAAELDPKDPLAWKNLGTAAYILEDYKGAVAAFQKALDLNPADAAAKTYRDQFAEEGARTYLQQASQSYIQGDYAAARNQSRKALDLQPDNAQAKEYLDLGEKKARELADRHYASGQAHLKKGEKAKALDEWKQALALAPDHGPAKAAINKLNLDRKAQSEAGLQAGARMLDREDFRGAIEAFKAAQAADPGGREAPARIKEAEERQRASARSHLERARAFQKKGDTNRAVAEYKASLGDVEDQAVRKALSDAQKENLDKEKKTIETAAVSPKPAAEKNDKALQALYMEGVSRYVGGDLEKAIEIWQKVLSEEPDHQGAQRGVKQARRELDELKKLAHG